MTYTAELEALAWRSEDAVVRIFEAWQAGELTTDEAVQLMANVVAGANAAAVSLADLSLAATLMVTLRTPVAAHGLTVHPSTPARLDKAARTLLSIDGVTPERVARLGRVEPLEAATRGYSEAIRQAPQVSGWRRGLDGNPCQLCTWWWREGRVFRDDHPMPRHKGCTCTQIPVVDEATWNHQTERNANEAARSARRRNAPLWT
ncbi:hypothetical protein [Isoptericola sp. NPDC055881]